MIASLGSRVWSLVATAMLVAAFDVAAITPLPSFADVKSAYGTSEALLLDRHGAPLSEVRIDPRVRQLDWIALDDVSPAVAATAGETSARGIQSSCLTRGSMRTSDSGAP